MARTKIEWCDYTVNPIKGLCPQACSYCYARRMYKRFHWDETVRFMPSVFNDMAKMKAGSRCFIGSTMELFGEWVEPEWMRLILSNCELNPTVTFIFLTKRPENLVKWSPFPKNVWVGVSAESTELAIDRRYSNIMESVTATVRFISVEPLLGEMTGHLPKWCNWVIVGQQTPINIKTTPKVEWVEHIVEVADTANVPVFLKQNLWNNALVYEGEKGVFFTDGGNLRQEFPKEKTQ